MPVRSVDEDSNLLGRDTVLSGGNSLLIQRYSHIPWDLNLQHCCENFKAHKAGVISSSCYIWKTWMKSLFMETILLSFRKCNNITPRRHVNFCSDAVSAECPVPAGSQPHVLSTDWHPLAGCHIAAHCLFELPSLKAWLYPYLAAPEELGGYQLCLAAVDVASL